MGRILYKPSISTHLGRVQEAMMATQPERAERWQDSEHYDGAIFTSEDHEKAGDIELLVLNRLFPVVNLILGQSIINPMDIVAKARTIEDGDTSEAMSEAVKFVMDQNQGRFLMPRAFEDAVVPGWGCLYAGYNPDPRRERVMVTQRDWKAMWWDPYGTPWLDARTTRYVFHMPWVDMDSLVSAFPKHKRDIEDRCRYLAERTAESGVTSTYYAYDPADEREQMLKVLGGITWVDEPRRRVRPVEMWYTVFEKCHFALFEDGRCKEISDKMPDEQALQIIEAATEILEATVKKVRVMHFLGDLVLMDRPSPYPHDEYPFIPWVGYIDRMNFPYGAIRQLRAHNRENSLRRSMALAMLRTRRVIVEEDVVDGGDEALNKLYEEANKLDGFLVVRSGKLERVKIHENADLARPQQELLMQGEREIQEISGANAELQGMSSNATSGTAMEVRAQRAQTIIMSLMANRRRSLHLLGNQIGALIQAGWSGPKMLRVTDRLTGADKMLALNAAIKDDEGHVTIRNNITQGIYDYVVTDAPANDTAREKNVEIIIEWIKKSPPEIIPHLMQVALEMSNLPNKDTLMMRLKPLMGADPRDEQLTPEEKKQKIIDQIESHAQQQQQAAQMQDAAVKLEIEGKALQNKKLAHEIESLDVKSASNIEAMVDARVKSLLDVSQAEQQARQAEQNEMAARIQRAAQVEQIRRARMGVQTGSKEA